MEIGSLPQVSNSPQQPSAPERVEKDRESKLLEVEPKQDEKKVASEEILTKIKDLTEGGLHSVRFEMDKEVNTLVVKIYDKQSDEVIRQVPAEELMNTAKNLRDYRGLLVDDRG